MAPDPRHRWYTLFLNPEPWAIGTAHARGISPNPALVTYQKAVKGELEGEAMLPVNMRKLTFYFYRKIDKYIDAADRVRSRNQVDATNLQKGLEDALQGVLFKNDREIRDIRSVILQQGHDVKDPFIIIHAEVTTGSLPGIDEIPVEVMELALMGPAEHLKKQSRWQGADDLF
jgi:Holliday junction resolvase RusA-like endonuclease